MLLYKLVLEETLTTGTAGFPVGVPKPVVNKIILAPDPASAVVDSTSFPGVHNRFNPGIIDGKIGSYTKEAIKAFQRKVGLIPDGVAGNRTKSEMKKYTGC